MSAHALLALDSAPAPSALVLERTREGAEERGLSLLGHLAHAHLSREAPLPADPASAARAALEDLPLHLLGARYAMFEPEVRRALPPSVIESWRFYTGALEVLGLGEVHVTDLAPSAAHDEVYLVRVTCEDGDGYLEVYASGGEPLASAPVRDGRVTSWDERFGALREDARRRSRTFTAGFTAAA